MIQWGAACHTKTIWHHSFCMTLNDVDWSDLTENKRLCVVRHYPTWCCIKLHCLIWHDLLLHHMAHRHGNLKSEFNTNARHWLFKYRNSRRRNSCALWIWIWKLSLHRELFPPLRSVYLRFRETASDNGLRCVRCCAPHLQSGHLLSRTDWGDYSD